MLHSWLPQSGSSSGGTAAAVAKQQFELEVDMLFSSIKRCKKFENATFDIYKTVCQRINSQKLLKLGEFWGGFFCKIHPNSLVAYFLFCK